jgi:hypothetical protein
MVPDLGVPRDLYDYPQSGVRADKAFAGDSTFALVAYGLSVPSGEFPIIILQDKVPEWQPIPLPVRDINHEDNYTD